MEDVAITRIMPNSLEAEQSVVGSMIMDKQAIITAGEMLVADDFYHNQYGVMFQTMVDMNNEGRPVDIVTLQERLKEKNVSAEVYSLEFIRDLLAAVPTSANIRQYAGIVKDKSILRNIIRVNDISLLIRLFLKHLIKFHLRQKTEERLPAFRQDLKIWMDIFQDFSHRILYLSRQDLRWVRRHLC